MSNLHVIITLTNFQYGHNSGKPVPSLCHRSRKNTYLFISEASLDRSHLYKKTVFKQKYTSFSLKLSQLITGLVPYFPQIKVSRVKIDFLKLVLPLLWRHS